MTDRSTSRRAGRLASAVIGAIMIGGVLPALVLAANGPQFTILPGGGAVGVAWAVQPVVSIMKGANIDTTAGGSITLSIRAGSGTAGAILTCAGAGAGGATFPVISGQAQAGGCAIDRAGAGYVLTATWSGGGSDDSAAFTISGGPATKLAFTTQPGGGPPGVAWASQPVVTVQDATGQTAIGSAATVTLVLASNPGGGILTCTGGLSKVAQNGIAMFAGCRIDKAGAGYTLAATSPGLAGATSGAFAITSASTATKLTFTTQPARGIPSGALATQPVLTIQDANGATVGGSTATVTLSLAANPGGGTLTCTGGLSRAAVNGVATFAGCAINIVGVGYALAAVSTGLTGASSAQFDVADRLAFATQPGGGAAGVTWAIQPVVAVRAGPTNTAVHDQATSVTLAIRAGSGAPGAVLTCTGGLTRAVVNGLATFAGCRIDRASPTSPANLFQLVATATNLTSATSNQFAVTGVAPTGAITVTPSASTITWGGTVVLTTRFAANGANRTFQLWGARDNRNPANFALITTQTTNSSGIATFAYTPPTNLFYEARFAGASGIGAATSPQARVVVRQIALLRPTNSGATRTVNRGTTITFTTTVRPSRPELTPATVTFWVFRRVSGVWQQFTSRNVTASAAGLALFTWSFSTSGSWYVRSMANPTPFNANSVKSPVELYNVN
jgi:hypothetical protein